MTTKTVESIINDVLAIEGEAYTNDPSDSGGPTKWGITQAVASKYGAGDVKNLTRERAYSIYYDQYVLAPKFAVILAIAPRTGAEMIDTGVNCGTGVPARWLQEWLNVLNNSGVLFKDVKVDGVLGAQTFAALRAYIDHRGPEGDAVLAAALNCEQGVYYKQIAARREKDEKFVFGWLRSRVLEQVRQL